MTALNAHCTEYTASPRSARGALHRQARFLGTTVDTSVTFASANGESSIEGIS